MRIALSLYRLLPVKIGIRTDHHGAGLAHPAYIDSAKKGVLSSFRNLDRGRHRLLAPRSVPALNPCADLHVCKFWHVQIPENPYHDPLGTPQMYPNCPSIPKTLTNDHGYTSVYTPIMRFVAFYDSP